MTTWNKFIPWVQLVIMICGLALIYGQQLQSIKDIERRTTKCEMDIRDQNVNSKEILNCISDIKGDVREMKVDLRYLRKMK